MTNPDEIIITPKAPEVTANVAIAAPVIFNNVHVTVQAPKPAPRAKSHKAPAHRAPDNAPSIPTIPKVAAAALPEPVDNGVTHHQDYHHGKERHTLTDRDGSTVTVVRSAESSDYTVTFDDKDAKFTTDSDKSGFKGTRRVPYGYGGVKSFAMEASAESTFTRATLTCQDNVSPLWLDGDTLTTSNKMIDTTTVREIQDFLKRNPQLAAELKKMNVPVTEVAGESQTVTDLGKFDPKVKACPRGRDDEYVIGLRGK